MEEHRLVVGKLGNVLENVLRFWKIISEDRSGLAEWTVRYFKRVGVISKMIRRTSVASRFNIYKFSEAVGLISMEDISKRDYFVTDTLFYFEPVHRFH